MYVVLENNRAIGINVDNKLFPKSIEAPDDIVFGDHYIDGEWIRDGERPYIPEPTPSEQRKEKYQTMTHKEDGNPLAIYKGEARTISQLTEEYNLYAANMSDKAMQIKSELSQLITSGYEYINGLYPD